MHSVVVYSDLFSLLLVACVVMNLERSGLFALFPDSRFSVLFSESEHSSLRLMHLSAL